MHLPDTPPGREAGAAVARMALSGPRSSQSATVISGFVAYVDGDVAERTAAGAAQSLGSSKMPASPPKATSSFPLSARQCCPCCTSGLDREARSTRRRQESDAGRASLRLRWPSWIKRTSYKCQRSCARCAILGIQLDRAVLPDAKNSLEVTNECII